MLGFLAGTSGTVASSLCDARYSEPCIDRQLLQSNAIQVVTHAQVGDVFWSQGIYPAMKQASADLRVSLEYSLLPAHLNLSDVYAAMSDQIRAAVGRLPSEGRPRALAVTLPVGSVVEQATALAVASGIPVIGLNTGSAAAARLGLRAFFGQDEREGECEMVLTCPHPKWAVAFAHAPRIRQACMNS
eukprot:258575-Prymnesium_polylepis.1